jgi:hypothetical protein
LGPEDDEPLSEPDEPEEPDDPDELDEPEPPESEVDEPPESDDDEPESDELPLSLDVEAPSPDAFELEDDRDALELPRSFFAQPDPLKWIVGGANSLRIVPSSPHDGQNRGPGSFRPWRMSVRWSQAVQAYS